MQITEREVQAYLGGPRTASRPFDLNDGVRVPPQIRTWLAEGRYCAGCQQRINEGVRHEVVGINIYHRSCATRAQQKGQPASSARPTVLCRIGGVALPHDQPCLIVDAEGRSEHEEFRSGCFDRSLAIGPYFLTLDHESRLEGRWMFVRSEARELRWEFELYDTSFNRGIHWDIVNGRIASCSIEFKPNPIVARWVGRIRVIDEAVLAGISILRNSRRPAWYGTSVTVL